MATRNDDLLEWLAAVAAGQVSKASAIAAVYGEGIASVFGQSLPEKLEISVPPPPNDRPKNRIMAYMNVLTCRHCYHPDANHYATERWSTCNMCGCSVNRVRVRRT